MKTETFTIHNSFGEKIIGDIVRPYQFLIDSKKYLPEKLEQLNTPTLILHGDKDEAVPLTQSQRLIKKLSEGTLLIIQGADHSTGIEGNYDTLQQHVKEWFSTWK